MKYLLDNIRGSRKKTIFNTIKTCLYFSIVYRKSFLTKKLCLANEHCIPRGTYHEVNQKSRLTRFKLREDRQPEVYFSY